MKPLSAGAKAGIAVGVVLGVLVIVGVIAWWCISRRRKRSSEETTKNLELMESKMRNEREVIQETKTPMLGGEERVEIEGDSETRDKRLPMLDGTERYEAPGLVGHEMDAGPVYAELDGASEVHR